MDIRIPVIILICLGLLLPLKLAGVFDTPAVPGNIKMGDVIPPKITDVKVINIISSGTRASAEITWITDEKSTSQVSYGLSNGYGTLQPPQIDTTMQTFHNVQLSGLSPQTTYHYKVISRDASGNETSSPDEIFVTQPLAGSSIGCAAPDFTLTCADGSSVTLSSLRGSKVIINFWHLNCTPCLNDMLALQQLHVKYPNLPMLCIHGTALGAVNATAVGAFLIDKAYTMTVPLDSNGQVSGLYTVNDVSWIPRTFFLDSNGIIRNIQNGNFVSWWSILDMLDSY